MLFADEERKIRESYAFDFLSNTVPGVKYEVSIPNSSINGNMGSADLVYIHDGIVEIYEIKPGSYAPGAVNNAAGIAQLQRYIRNYRLREGYQDEMVMRGTSLNSVIAVTMLPSKIHPDKMIKYYVYPSDPGMIYWGYVNRHSDPGEVAVLDKKQLKPKHDEAYIKTGITTDDVLEGLGEVAITGLVAYVLYEVVKWSDEKGRLAQKTLPNGIQTTYAYNAQGRLTELTHTDREGILDHYAYRYDLRGNKTAIEKHRKGLPQESGPYAYAYDAPGRLSAVTKNGEDLRLRIRRLWQPEPPNRRKRPDKRKRTNRPLHLQRPGTQNRKDHRRYPPGKKIQYTIDLTRSNVLQ